jgi:hypothetical protein
MPAAKTVLQGQSLSSRERQVIRLVAEARTNKEIALRQPRQACALGGEKQGEAMTS